MSNIPTGKKIYLCTPSLKPITVLNGIDTESVSYSEHLRDYSSLTFDVYENVVIDGKQVKSNGYDELDVYMYLYLEDIAYFQMQYPQVQNDGIKEYKSITAYSIDKEWEDKDWVNFKVNTGEKDSLEQLVDDNTDDLGFTINFIDFYNPNRHDLSLIHIVLEKMPNWSVDDEDIDRTLWKKRLSFSEDSINLYALMTSVIAPNAECIFVFDCLNRKIKAIAKSNLDFDTNIFIGFRNLASNIEQSVNEDSVFTRFNVAGGNDLTVNDWNFNNGRIFNLDYFMHEPYMSQEQVAKFRDWIDWQNEHREEFANLSQNVSDLEAKIYDLKYRVPDDGCEIDQWKNMNKEGLEESLKYYQSLLNAFGVSVDENPTYTGSDGHTYHVKIDKDKNNNEIRTIVDENDVPIQAGVTLTYNAWDITEDGETHVDYDRYLELLQNMENGKAGYYTYYEIVKYIIPNIETALWNLENAPTDDDEQEYDDSFETNWELYGSEELNGRLEDYQNRVDVLEQYSTYPAYFYKIKRLTEFEDKVLDSFKVTDMTIQADGTTYTMEDILAIEGVDSVGFMTDEDEFYVGLTASTNELFSSGITEFECTFKYKATRESSEESSGIVSATNVTPTIVGTFNADEQWERLYNEYWEKIGYIGDEETEDTIKWWIKQLEAQIDEIGSEEQGYNRSRMEMVAKVSMYETEILESDENDYSYDVVELDDPNAEWGFTLDDIKLFHTLMHDTDYTNENILTTSLNTTSTITSTETIIQKEKELYEDAVEKLSEISQPQINFSVGMDNIMQIKEFEGLREDCSLLRFIRLGVRDDYSVKLRIVGRSWNPCEVTDDFTLEFSNMISSNSGRSDLTDLLNNTSGNAGKNSISLGSGNSDSDKEYAANLLSLMVSTGLFSSAVAGSGVSGSVDESQVNDLIEDYLLTNVINEASFNKLFSKYIDVELLVADAIKTATISTDQITDNDGHVFADLVNSSIDIGAVTTNIIEGKDSQGKFYIDLLTGEIAIDKLVSSDGKTAVEFIDGAVSTDKIVTNIIQGQDGQGNYYMDLIEGKISIDHLVSSDGSTAVDFINGALSTDVIATNLITGKDGNSSYYMDLLTGYLNMNTIVSNQIFTNKVNALSADAAIATIDTEYVTSIVAQNMTLSDLQVGDIVLSDQMRILSEEDGTDGMIMSGSEIQFLDGDGNVSISIGYNTISDGQGGTTVDYDHPAIIIKDENGQVMLNSQGLEETDIGLAPMIQNNSIDEGKLSFDIVKTANGEIIVQNYDGSQSTWGQALTEFISDTTDSLGDVDEQYESVINSIIPSIATKDANTGKWSLVSGILNNTYVYLDAEHTQPISLNSLGTKITTTAYSITQEVSRTYVKSDNLKSNYVVCSSPVGNSAKSASCSDSDIAESFELYDGVEVTCVFANGNNVANPTLSVNGTTSAPIKAYNGADLEESEYTWVAGSTYTFLYVGGTNPHWRIKDSGTIAQVSYATVLAEQTADNYIIKATKTATSASGAGGSLIESIINVAPESIKIRSENLQLEGAAIFNSYTTTADLPSKLREFGYVTSTTIADTYATKSNAVVKTQRIYRQTVDSSPTQKPETPGTTSNDWVVNEGDLTKWAIKRMSYSPDAPLIWTCEQRLLADGTIAYTPVLLDDTTTVIDGGKIITHSIHSNQLATDAITSLHYNAPTTASYPYSVAGTFLDLDTGNITSPNFAVTGTDAYLKGTIETGAGHIGGFVITENSIYHNKRDVSSVELDDSIHIISSDPYVLDEEDYLNGGYASLYEVYMGVDGISCGFGKFAVDSSGELFASDATITGNITANSLTINESANVSGLIKAINSSTDASGGSLVKISADKIQFEGATIFDSYSLKNDTIKDVIVEYALSSSDSDFIAVSGSAGQWNTVAPDRTTGTYMWQRTGKLVNGKSNYSYTYTCIQGADGGTGSSVSITSIKYAVTTTDSQPADSAFTYTTVPTVPEGSWLWCLTEYSSGNKMYSKAKQGKSPTVSKSGNTVTITDADGDTVTVSDGTSPTVYKEGDTVHIISNGVSVEVKDGTNGQSIKGDDGKPAYLHIAWANSANGSTDFSTTASSNKLYMGTYTDEIEADSTDYTKYSWVKVKGDQGKSLTGVTEYYARNNSTTAPADSAFGTSILTPTSSEKYVWNYEVLSWNDNGATSTTKTNKHIVAMYGSEGKDGKSLVSVTEYYTVNNNASNTPSYDSFSTTVVAPTADNRYLWNYELLTWNDNGATSTERTAQHIAGVYGDRGVSITSVEATNNTEDDGYSTVKIKWGNGNEETFRVKNGSKGEQGEPGVIAQWYYGTLLEHKTGTATLVASATEGAVVGSMYLNTDTSDIYQCTVVGNPNNTWIYAGNLASGLLDSIEIGGANLLRQLPKQYSSAAYNAYQLYLTENLVANQTYTIQFWDVDVSHTGKSAANLGLSVYWGGGSVSLVNMNGTDYFTNGHADHLTATFTVTSSQASGSGASNAWLNIYNSVPSASGTMSMEIKYWKLEKGNIPTDWSSAPGDQIGKVQQIYYRSSSSSKPNPPSDTAVIRSDEVNMDWTTRRLPMIDKNNTSYKYCYTCAQYISILGEFLGASEVVQDEAHTVIDGGNIITNTVTANQINFADATGNTLKLYKPNTSAHFLIDGSTLQAYNSSNQLYFEVTGTTMKYGVGITSTVATTAYADGKASDAEGNAKNYADGKASTAEGNAKSYADGVAGDAAWSVTVSVSTINYKSNTATLVAKVYKYGVEQSSGFTVQWYKNGSAISGATSLTSPTVTPDAVYTCIVS